MYCTRPRLAIDVGVIVLNAPRIAGILSLFLLGGMFALYSVAVIHRKLRMKGQNWGMWLKGFL